MAYQKLVFRSKESQDKFFAFVAICVMQNVKFPSQQIGAASNTTIQNLIHDYPYQRLTEYVDTLKHKIPKLSLADEIAGKDQQYIEGSSLTVNEAVQNLTELAWARHNALADEKRLSELNAARKELESLKTPKERRTELEARIKELEGLTG